MAAGGLAVRLPALGKRPMHADEAVQARRFRDLWLCNRYRYDPHEYHGPTLPYATLPFFWLAGPTRFADTTEAMFRVVPVFFGAGLILLLGLVADALGKPATLCAAALAAISPAMVFYSRYYIHETLLVFFTLAAIGSVWRYLRTGRLRWCVAGGGCVGLMQATKETCVLVYASAAVAVGLAAIWSRGRVSPAASGAAAPVPPAARQEGRRPWPAWHGGCAAAAAILVAAVLLSSWGAHPRGAWDGLRAYAPWLRRAAGHSAHAHPWYFYLRILACWRSDHGPLWSEGLILGLAAIGGLVAFLPTASRSGGKDFFARWAALYPVLLGAAYSAIPYKTPWCLLGFLHGMTLPAGLGAVAIVRAAPGRFLKGLAVAGLLAAAGQLAWQSYRASYVLCADPRNPYVYAQTLPDTERLARDVQQLSQASREGDSLAVKVIWKDSYYWPLPWYLRRFGNVEYWTRMPGEPSAPLVIASPEFDAPLTETLDATHLMTGYYAVRPNVLAQLWVRMDVWESHLRRLGRL